MHRNTTVCECQDHVFTAADIKPPIMSMGQALGFINTNLYGGNVKRFANAECPKCGYQVLLWLKPAANSYRVLTTSVVDTRPEDEDDLELTNPLEAMNMATLRQLAKERGLKNYVKYNKAELAQMLQAQAG